MADVMEVLRALCTATRGSLANLQKLAAKKRRRVGGFGKGIVLVETEEAPLIEVKVHPGLFGPRGSKSSTGIAKSVVAAGRRPKTQHDRIIVPLIPSAPSQLRGPARIYFRQLGLSFKVLYKEKTIEIVLERETHPVDANQLSLPFATAK
jgi:hypothetical protein